jgi:putative NADPH-quinone reductase
MKKVLTFNGSPRPAGNTTFLLQSFLDGAGESGSELETIRSHDLNLDPCAGCLRCNILKRCSLRGDEWQEVSDKIEEADILVFAAPVYFHHVPGPMKIMLDRFRSFVHVQMTPTGLIHTPHRTWNKDFVLILSMGSSDPSDADPIIELFEFVRSMLGEGNKLHVIKATRLGVVKQVAKTEEELKVLYDKLNLPVDLATADAVRNQELMKECRNLGATLGK